MITRRFRFVLLTIVMVVLTVGTLGTLELDQSELEQVEGADIDFENYEGPVDRIDTREEIRGIGRTLGAGVRTNRFGTYGGRYTVRRVIGDASEPLRAADIIELNVDAGVDHIVNLRRIVSGYLQAAWDYSRTDADLVAKFVTIYNAVHRGDMQFFTERYRSDVVAYLEAERAGLATSYREWAGKTQIVVPIRDEREPGDLDAVDPRQLIDSTVIAELRSRADLGIEDRKAIIEFIERVIEERREAIDEEREQIEREQEEIDQRQEEIEQEIAEAEDDEPEVEEAAPRPEPTVEEPDQEDEAETPSDSGPEQRPVPEPEREPEPEPEPVAEPQEQPVDDEAETEADTDDQPTRDELETEQEELEEREEQLQDRREELDDEEEEIEDLTEEVEDLYQDTAEDQEAADSGVQPTEIVPFVLAADNGTYELAVVDLNSVELAGEQTVPIVSPAFVSFQGGLLVAHADSGRMLLLDSTSLGVIAESDVAVVPGARIRVIGTSVFTVISEKGEFFVGEFDAQLVLQRRSAESVRRETDIVNRGDRLLVQGADGTLRRLDLTSFE